MRHLRGLTLLLLFGGLAGCATFPTGPSVNVLPAPGKSFDTFMSEDATCRRWADSQLDRPIQEGHDESVATGAVAGTAIGAGAGALLGAASGNMGAGAAFGAATGLLFGSAIGSDAGQAYGYSAQRRYDNAYVQCMYSYGNQVPGVRRVAKVKAAAPPPPPAAPAPPADSFGPPADAVAPPAGTLAPPAAAYQPPSESSLAPPPPPPAAESEAQYYAPPEIYAEEAPQFVYSPPLNMYVAVGVPYDLVYNGYDYFYFYDGRWYRSAYYNGPWVYVPRRAYPRVFVDYRISRIRRYRDVEYRRYVRERDHYAGRLHRPEYRGRHTRSLTR